MKRAFLLLMLAISGISILPLPCHAGPTGWRSVGIRGGGGTADVDTFYLYEGFAAYQLPWGWRGDSGWRISTQAAISAGVLEGEGDSGFISTIGPSFPFGKAGFPLEGDVGVSVAFLSRDTFGNRDYNGNAQFVSHIGLTYRLGSRWGLGYRFQHMSNAGLNGSRNPGINMHLIGVSWFLMQ